MHVEVQSEAQDDGHVRRSIKIHQEVQELLHNHTNAK